jgi:hypothetical protein
MKMFRSISDLGYLLFLFFLLFGLLLETTHNGCYLMTKSDNYTNRSNYTSCT